MCRLCLDFESTSVAIHVVLRAPVPSACHLVCRWCGMMWASALGATAWFVTRYDSKGDGLMSLAGRTQRRWSVSSHRCNCRMPRPALNRVAWEACITFPRDATLSHTQLCHTQFCHAQLFHTLFFTHISPTHNTRLSHTRNPFKT